MGDALAVVDVQFNDVRQKRRRVVGWLEPHYEQVELAVHVCSRH
jgi:hypothetical protein